MSALSLLLSNNSLQKTINQIPFFCHLKNINCVSAATLWILKNDCWFFFKWIIDLWCSCRIIHEEGFLDLTCILVFKGYLWNLQKDKNWRNRYLVKVRFVKRLIKKDFAKLWLLTMNAILKQEYNGFFNLLYKTQMFLIDAICGPFLVQGCVVVI